MSFRKPFLLYVMKDVHKSDYRSLSYAISAKIIVLPSFHFSFFLQTSGGHHPKVQPIIFGVRDRDWVPLHQDPSFLLSCDCFSSFFLLFIKKFCFFLSFFFLSFSLPYYGINIFLAARAQTCSPIFNGLLARRLFTWAISLKDKSKGKENQKPKTKWRMYGTIEKKRNVIAFKK